MPSGNLKLIVAMFYPLLWTLFAIKTYINGFTILSQNKALIAAKTLEQCFLKEFKATCKNFSESELKKQRPILCDISQVIH